MLRAIGTESQCFRKTGARICGSAVDKERLATFMMLAWWFVWSERNMRSFQSKQRTISSLVDLTPEELAAWKSAGLKVICYSNDLSCFVSVCLAA